MLVRFENTKSRSVWVNPIHARLLRDKRNGRTHISMTGNGMEAASVVVEMSPDDVAALPNAGMPLGEIPPLDGGAGLVARAD